jgi:hypothetical protein
MRLAASIVLSCLISAGAAYAGQPDAPGTKGHAKAIETKGFAKSIEATGQGLTNRAADVFGNNGKGNGADPDSLGLSRDHDPNNFGGEPDTERLVFMLNNTEPLPSFGGGFLIPIVDLFGVVAR